MRTAEENGLARVTRVELVIGELAGVQPELLQMAYEILSKGTIVAGAQLVIHPSPLLLYCRACDNHYVGAIDDLLCPACDGEDFQIISGRELMVRSILGERNSSEAG